MKFTRLIALLCLVHKNWPQLIIDQISQRNISSWRVRQQTADTIMLNVIQLQREA